jgi:hypothetical protein
LPKKGSWTIEKVLLLCGRMDYRLSSVLLRECVWNASRLRLPNRTSMPEMRASISRSKHFINLNRMLEKHHILLCLQETDLEVQEKMLSEE